MYVCGAESRGSINTAKMSLLSYLLVSQIYNNARDWKIHWLTDDVFALYLGIVEAYLMYITVCGLKVCLFQMENTHT